ncbi:MAG: 2-hydroxyacyl-CoA dehydratase family protein [Thermoguttaceae bacterium]
MTPPRRITIEEWDARHAQWRAAGLCEPEYGGPLGRHAAEGDSRLLKLRMDDSRASLRLWNFLLTEDERLFRAQSAGKKIVGAMKDLGTVPVMAYSLPGVVAFYPDGAWWLPCLMERNTKLLAIADSLGIDDSFCPVRAMLGAFAGESHFPAPGLLTCSVGATCDDFSAIAQRLPGLGFPILWWEVPHRRRPDPGEAAVGLPAGAPPKGTVPFSLTRKLGQSPPGGFTAPESQVAFVKAELERVRQAIEAFAGEPLGDERLAAGIAQANRVRQLLDELRQLAYSIDPCPLPALEMLVAEMLAIHFCSDRDEAIRVLEELAAEVRSRVGEHVGVLPAGAARIYWVNPVADLRVMNLLEDAGGRLCGSEYLFCHALATIPEDLPPMEALARTALADPMVGSALDRAEYICRDIRRFGAEAVVVSRIPGASHCALEGQVIAEAVHDRLGIPVLEIEVPPITDSIEPTLRTRLEALVEIVRQGRLP